MTPGPAEPPEPGAGQRLRVGALGLAGVFLLVMLATALLHATADADLANHPAAVANAAEPSEPLAELGVAPGPAPDEAAPAPAAAKPPAR